MGEGSDKTRHLKMLNGATWVAALITTNRPWPLYFSHREREKVWCLISAILDNINDLCKCDINLLICMPAAKKAVSKFYLF